jgi:mannitol/fructose-specific phosphotransferase system IIA component (Ntr-type)
MGHLESQPIWAAPTTPSNHEAIIRCGCTLAETRKVELLHIGDQQQGSDAVLASARQNIADKAPSMLLSDWPEDNNGSSLVQFALEQELNALFVRWPKDRQIKRIIIPTSGGSAILRQLWVAQAIAKQQQCSAQVVHIVREDDPDALDSATTKLLARGQGISTPVVLLQAPDVLAGMASLIEKDDLVIFGAPNPWRLTEHFDSTLPAQVAKAYDNPLMMMLSARPARIRLRNVFWPQMIALKQASTSRDQVIAQLVEILVSHNQVPSFWRDRLIEQALNREEHASTAVGSDTAFPHITMPIHGGLTGCMGIYPDGVAFGGDNDQSTRFVFMLLTPQDCYGEYLEVLAKISRKLIDPALRQQLLACNKASEVLELLDPDDDEHDLNDEQH